MTYFIRHRMRVALLAAVALACFGAMTHAQENHDALIKQVQTALIAKCGDCHGSMAKKADKFDYIDNLARLAANDKLIIKGKPDKSAVFTQVDEGEMPPPKKKLPEMTSDEQAALKKWIELGAPVNAVVAPPPAKPQETTFQRLVTFVGKFHPLAAHFPVALFVGAALAEFLYLVSRARWLSGAVRFMAAFGAVSAVGTIALGWLRYLAFQSKPSAHEAFMHGVLGTGATVLVLVVGWLSENANRKAQKLDQDWKGASRFLFRLLLIAGMALVGLAAHMGGELRYGSDYFIF